MAIDNSPVQAPGSGSYRVDHQHLTVSCSGRHLFGLGTVHATFRITSGEMQVLDPVSASTVTVEADPASVSSATPSGTATWSPPRCRTAPPPGDPLQRHGAP